jgi:bifunctional non-homologous end joining protein LigD
VALEVYRKKRKFDVTAEPRGHKARRGGNRYVIQKHAAQRLHYDLRLELDGVMKSWAVTRGPSLDPGEKRLAVHVEDHPIEYNAFEGTIPKGEYGGGTVMIWDRGRWIPEGDPHKGYAKGHLDFELMGAKLRGRWHLVRMRKRERDRHENWLLIKGKDEESRTSRDKDILEEKPRSVVTGRSIDEIAAGKGKKRVWHSNRGDSEEKARTSVRAAAANAAQKKSTATHEKKLPDFVPPSLATPSSNAPRGAEWLHEVKFDGYRIEAWLDHGKVRLLTRNRQDWTHRFKPIAETVAALPAEAALLDGELVVENDKGISSFSLLQTDLKDDRSDRFVYYVFDLLHLNGRDLSAETLVARKAVLRRLLKRTSKNDRIRYTDHFTEDGPLIFKHACSMELEGIVSKRRDAPYRSGRSENFVKTKCHNAQEFVVTGYSPSTAEPNAVGALAVAAHENGKLRYAGRIGTGYTRKTARDLWQRLARLRIERPPIALPKDERRKDVIWVKPQVVVEAEFRGVTHDNLLRQASYKGLREDKLAREVVREAVATVAPAAMSQRQAVRKSPESTAKFAPTAARRATSPAKFANGRASAPDGADVANIHLTHPDRVYWVDAGVTKEDLAAYYLSVWDWIAPHIVGRALSLVRAPEGVGGETFFQKHIAANVKSSPLRRSVTGKDHDVIAVETRDDLVSLVQSAALEIHVRGSRLDSLESCDRIVFDLDPGQGVGWTQIIAAAREVHERLMAEKLESFVKLSGGKGIHVVAPIADVDWGAAKSFTQRIASAMSADSPKLYLAKMTKSLREGRIFIDYFRNSREATSVAPYSTRARPGAAVSAPLSWEQLGRTKSADEFTVLNLKRRLRHDPWASIGKVRQKLPEIGRRRG